MSLPKTSCLPIILLFAIVSHVQGQSVSPFIVNSAGGSYHPTGSYMQYEWSIGELAVISTFAGNNAIVTNGALQPCTENVSIPAYTSRFADGELRLFPNPTPGKFELNIAVPIPGRISIELVNVIGQSVIKRNFRNECCGHIEYFDISGLPGGIYMVVATLEPDVTLADNKTVVRRSAIKVVKIQN